MPGLNFFHVHLNRLIEGNDLKKTRNGAFRRPVSFCKLGGCVHDGYDQPGIGWISFEWNFRGQRHCRAPAT